jgi:galactonate dehydratase
VTYGVWLRYRDAGVALKISSIEAIPVRIPRDRERAQRTAGSPTPLDNRERQYRWSTVFPALYSIDFETALVRVTLDDGTIGWGEAQAPLAPEVACAIIDRLLCPVLRGAEFDGSIEDIASFWDRMYSTMRVRGQTGGFMLDAISGIDLALWDLAGKMQGQPVCSLIPESLRRTEVPAYLSGVPGASIDARVEHAIARHDEGFRTFKLFYDCGPKEFLDALSALRRSLPQDTGIAVDALWRLSPESAVEFGLALDQQNALWLEAPLPPEDAPAHAALAARIRTPIAIGESYRTRYELASFVRAGGIGYLQPDLGRCGLTEGLRIACMARELGIPVVPHLSIAMGPQIAAAIHFAAALSNCELLEFNPNVLSVANGFLAEPLECRGGLYRVPSGPGMGVDVRYNQLADHL